MEAAYKDALRSAYKLKLTKTPSREYRDHLFPIGWCYRAINKEAVVRTEPAKVEVTEKAKVIESLKDFTQDLLEKNMEFAKGLDAVEMYVLNDKNNGIDADEFNRLYKDSKEQIIIDKH